MTRANIFALVLLALSPLITPAALAAQSYDNCTGYITVLPAIISTQGTWCLKQDLATANATGAAITINTNNVTIDCNDFKLGGLAAGLGTSTFGIYAQDRFNATVRRCNIRGFYVGLVFAGSSGGGHAVEDNRFDTNTRIGMLVQGDGSVIRRNRVTDTGQSTVFSNAIGIATEFSVDIVNNTVSGVTATTSTGGNAYGISSDFNDNGRIAGNGVRGLVQDGAGVAYGIYNTNSDRITMRENDVVGVGASSVGLTCSSANGTALDNMISHFATAIDTCSNSSGNTVIP